MVPDRRRPSKSTRAYPRLTKLEVDVSIRLRAKGTKSGRPDLPPKVVNATLHDLSPEGACVDVVGDLKVRRRDWLTLKLKIHEKILELPAMIAWANRADGQMRLGLKLHLEAAPAATRLHFAKWIVAAIQETARSPTRGRA